MFKFCPVDKLPDVSFSSHRKIIEDGLKEEK